MSDSLHQFAVDLRLWIQRLEAACPESGKDPRDIEDARFGEWAMRLFTLQYESNLPYRGECRGRGISPQSLTDWQSIPAMPTAAFKDSEFSCVATHHRIRCFLSSGTTGHKPSRHFHSEESLAVYEASLWPWFRRHLMADTLENVGDAILRSGRPFTLISLTPPAAAAPDSSLVYMFEVVMRNAAGSNGMFLGTVNGDGSWSISGTAVMEALTKASIAGSRVILLGTAFNFVHLLDHCQGAGCRVTLPRGSRIMETGGYKGRSRTVPRAELLSGLASCLGLPLEAMVSEYGMSELSSQAYDSVAGVRGERLLQFPPWARGRVISVETGREVIEGEGGLLRVVDLANVGSVLAVQTEDLAVRRGDGFQLLGRANASEARGCSLRSGGQP